MAALPGGFFIHSNAALIVKQWLDLPLRRRGHGKNGNR
jgi:hypothetical protein